MVWIGRMLIDTPQRSASIILPATVSSSAVVFVVCLASPMLALDKSELWHSTSRDNLVATLPQCVCVFNKTA